MYAESQDERHKCHNSLETLTAHWETLQSNVISWASRVSEMVFATRQSTERLRVLSVAIHGLCFSDHHFHAQEESESLARACTLRSTVALTSCLAERRSSRSNGRGGSGVNSCQRFLQLYYVQHRLCGPSTQGGSTRASTTLSSAGEEAGWSNCLLQYTHANPASILL